ncbi:MAG: MarR family winged helix-turn-helix transcriptional regulator [Acidimicrobiales bacterium]
MALLDDDRLTAVGLFLEAHDGLVSALERALDEDCGMSRQWFEILLRLARSPRHSLRMCDLAAQTGLSPSGLTRAVDRLEAVELVRRRSCPSDRRVAYAELTPLGLERVTSAAEIHLSHIDEHFIAHLSRAELDQLERITRKLRDQLRPNAALVTR